MLFREINNRTYESFFDTKEDELAYEVMSIEQADVRNGILAIPAEHNGHRVLSVGKGAGAELNIRRLVIRPGVQKVDNSAFENSTIEELFIPSSVKFIGNSAFKNCVKLKSIAPMDNVNLFLHLENECFKGCSELKTVVMAPKIIPISAFEDCVKLDYVLDSRVQEIDAFAFKNTNVKAVSFNAEKCNLRFIGTEAFAECKNLKTVNIPTRVDVRDEAFARCRNLTEAIIGENSVMGEMVFTECRSLKVCNWPNSLKTVEYGTFCDCPKLETVNGCGSIIRVKDYGFYNTGLKTLAPFKSLKMSNADENSFGNCRKLPGSIIRRRRKAETANPIA